MKNNIKRRDFIKKAGVAGVGVAAASTLSSPSIAGGHQEWILVSAFGKAGLLGQAIQAFADNITPTQINLILKFIMLENWSRV